MVHQNAVVGIFRRVQNTEFAVFKVAKSRVHR